MSEETGYHEGLLLTGTCSTIACRDSGFPPIEVASSRATIRMGPSAPRKRAKARSPPPARAHQRHRPTPNRHSLQRSAVTPDRVYAAIEKRARTLGRGNGAKKPTAARNGCAAEFELLRPTTLDEVLRARAAAPREISSSAAAPT